MTYPICIKSGWIDVTVSPQKRFDNPETFQEIIDPEELLSCWHSVKHIVGLFSDIVSAHALLETISDKGALLIYKQKTKLYVLLLRNVSQFKCDEWDSIH